MQSRPVPTVGEPPDEPDSGETAVGWYSDATAPGILRWWDGEQWTDLLAVAVPPARASTAGRIAGGCLGSVVLGVATIAVALWILGRTDGRMMEQEPLLAFPPFFVALPVGFYLGAKAVGRSGDRQPPTKQ